MSDFSCDVPLNSQLDVFHPMLLDLAKKVTTQFSQSIKVDLSTSPWWLISDSRTKLDFLRPHSLEAPWGLFQQYLINKQELFLFLEEPMLGIVHKKAQFWLFFDPRLAASYFQRQSERPKNFTKAAIKKFPPIALLHGLTLKARSMAKNQDDKAMNSIKRLEETIALADAFMPVDEAAQFTQAIRKILVLFSLSEVRTLKKDITNPGVSPTLLEKRLQAIYRLCLRLYSVRQDDREREVLKKLISPKIVIRKKALEIVEQRLSKDVG